MPHSVPLNITSEVIAMITFGWQYCSYRQINLSLIKSKQPTNTLQRANIMKNLYLTLAIIGAIIPYFFVFQFIQAEGFDLPLFLSLLFANNASANFTSDLLVTSLVFWVFIFQRYNHLNKPKPYWFIVINLTIGLSCALPAYLYACEIRSKNS